MSDTIICYVIACPRRLGRIHRLLKKHACSLQYSVFLFSGTQAALQNCLQQLQTLMDPRHDDIRAYPLPERGLRWCVGQSTLPEGIYLGSLPAPWQAAPGQITAEPASTMPEEPSPPYMII